MDPLCALLLIPVAVCAYILIRLASDLRGLGKRFMR